MPPAGPPSHQRTINRSLCKCSGISSTRLCRFLHVILNISDTSLLTGTPPSSLLSRHHQKNNLHQQNKNNWIKASLPTVFPVCLSQLSDPNYPIREISDLRSVTLDKDSKRLTKIFCFSFARSLCCLWHCRCCLLTAPVLNWFST